MKNIKTIKDFLNEKSKPLGNFDYYFNNAIDRLSKSGVRITDIRDEPIRGHKCIVILYSEIRNPDIEHVKIFYNTEDERNIVLNRFSKK